MTSRFTELVIDCRDPERLAAFWCAALGFEVLERFDSKIEIGSWEPTIEAVRATQAAPTLVFQSVPEEKTVKNRLQLDISPIDTTTDEEVERLLALGGTRTSASRVERRGWVVLRDPEDNEFCVRSLAPGQV
jgi:hypothetical protein